jgi:tetratricopeptide (TPR) repeat protein
MNKTVFSLAIILFISVLSVQDVVAQSSDVLQDTIKVLTKKDKQEAEKKYNEGVIFFQSNKYDAAITKFNQAIAIKAKFPEAFYNRASAKFAKGDLVESIQDFNYAITLNPVAKYYLARGIAEYQYQEYEGAKLDLNNAIQKDSGEYRTDAYYYLACVYFGQEKYDEAIDYYSKAINMNDKYTFAYHDRGSAYRMTKKYQLALADYRKAIQLNPKMAIAFNNMGSVKKLLKDYQGALIDYSSAINLDSNDAIAYNNRGTVYKELKQTDKAMFDFSKAIAINPSYAIAYSNRANLKFNNKDYENALKDYNRALELDANYGIGFLNRGICKEMMRDSEGACKDWSKANALGVSVAGDYMNAQCK